MAKTVILTVLQYIDMSHNFVELKITVQLVPDFPKKTIFIFIYKRYLYQVHLRQRKCDCLYLHYFGHRWS